MSSLYGGDNSGVDGEGDEVRCAVARGGGGGVRKWPLGGDRVFW